jgi:hypothetical protein
LTIRQFEKDNLFFERNQPLLEFFPFFPSNH